MYLKDRIEKIVKDSGIPYLDVAVSQNHRLLFRQQVGELTPGVPMTGNEVYWAFSCTKPLTVTCAMRLIEEGKLALEDPLAKYLPEFASLTVLQPDGTVTPAKNTVTVWHLMTMSAGFDYDFESVAHPESEMTTREAIAGLAKRPLCFEPGTRFQYSLCHDVLAAVIEVAAGEGFAAYMKRIILDPLGMTHSGFDPAGITFAPMYQCHEDKHISPIAAENPFMLSKKYESGGAGLITTTEDYMKFVDTMACGGCAADGYRLLKPESVKLLRTPQTDKLVEPRSFDCVQGPEYSYGLGVRTRIKTTRWNMPSGEFGWDGAAGAYMLADPVHHISVVMTMHLRCWPGVFGGKNLDICEEIYREMNI